MVGRENVDPSLVVDTESTAPGLVMNNFWLSLNGWFGIKIDCERISLVVVVIPKLKVTEVETPTSVPYPTEFVGLK